MTLSRPFQAILAALVLFVLAWFVVLHRPGSESTGSSSGSSSAAPVQASPSAAHATSSTNHSGASTGATDPSKAHTTRLAPHATRLAPHTTRSAPHTTRSAGHAAPAKAQVKHVTTHATATGHSKAAVTNHASASHGTSSVSHPTTGAGASPGSTQTPVMQAKVEAELKAGKVVLLLFWNPHSSDDSAVHRQVQIVAGKLGGHVAVHTAAANQVGSFGSITRNVQVFQTPTLLIVNPKGQVTTVTGYTDAYALEQTIREARG